MPQFTIPPNTRALGGPNPAGDMDNVSTALSATVGLNVMNTAYSGGATGNGSSDDTAAIQATLNAASSGGDVIMPPGTYKITPPLTISNTSTRLLAASGAILVPASAGTGPMVNINAGDVKIEGVRFYGGTGTRSSNPACDAVGVAAGVTRWKVRNCGFFQVNGWCVNAGSINAATHGHITDIWGTNCAGGIKLVAASGVTTQCYLARIDLPQCETSELLLMTNVQDCMVSQIGGYTISTNTLPCLHISGACSNNFFSGMDLGGGSASGNPAVLLIEDAGGNGPSQQTFHGGVFEHGGYGVQVTGSAGKLDFSGIYATNSQLDGFQFANTGNACSLYGCVGNGNNVSAGTAYDVNVTSTGKVGIFGFCYQSPNVTARLNITSASNHVTEANPSVPSGKGTAGNAPAGW